MHVQPFLLRNWLIKQGEERVFSACDTLMSHIKAGKLSVLPGVLSYALKAAQPHSLTILFLPASMPA